MRPLLGMIMQSTYSSIIFPLSGLRRGKSAEYFEKSLAIFQKHAKLLKYR